MRLALAIPHLPDDGPRTLAANALLHRLGFGPDLDDFCEAAANAGLEHIRIFKDREPNHAWAFRVWSWFASLDTEWSIQLQDDTLTPPKDAFWPILRAQLTAAPGDVVGLATVHPRAPAIMRSGARWFRTRAWSIGWGVAYRTSWVRDVLLPFRERFLEQALRTNEDSFVNDCVVAHSGSVYHPVPSLVDHDLTLESTYASVDDGHRRATAYIGELADTTIAGMVNPDFWRPREATELLPFPEKTK
jgi:hypothetical protein